MKKSLFITLITLASFSVNAQDIHFGVKAGLNLASLGGDAEVDSRTSFHIGGLAEIKVSEKFSVQPELLYSAQGAVAEGNSDIVTQLDYINLPVFAKFYVAEGLSLEGGPQVGFAINRNVDADGEDVDADDAYKPIDFGVGIGASYKLEQGLFFSARYNLGLSNILEEEVFGPDAEAFNNVIQFSVGYSF